MRLSQRGAPGFSRQPPEIHRGRIESVAAIAADVVTARALAELDEAPGHAERFLKPDGICLFLKGGRRRMN